MVSNVLNSELKNVIDSFEYSDELRNKTFLVSGATGLIGSVFVKMLLQMNQCYNMNIKIIAIVRDLEKGKELFKGYIMKDDEVLFFVGDMSDYELQYRIKEQYDHIDYIVHAASVTTSKYMVENPVDTIYVAFDGTRNMLELAKAYNVKQMIYLSSMEMYGSLDKDLVVESDLGYIDLSNVRTCYPESKRMCENLCLAYSKQYNVNVCCARLAQTFGPGISKSENRVFAQFAKSVINKKDIVLRTKGLSEGNYCYITDVMQALLILLCKGEAGESYNIANESCHTTIREMAQMVCSKIGNNEIKVIFDIPEDNNTFGYAPDVKLMLSSEKMRRIGFNPQVDLEESYRRLIAYMQECNIC